MFLKIAKSVVLILPILMAAISYFSFVNSEPNEFGGGLYNWFVVLAGAYLVVALLLLIMALVQFMKKRRARKIALWGLASFFLAIINTVGFFFFAVTTENRDMSTCDTLIEKKLANDRLPIPSCMLGAAGGSLWSPYGSRFCKTTPDNNLKCTPEYNSLKRKVDFIVKYKTD